MILAVIFAAATIVTIAIACGMQRQDAEAAAEAAHDEDDEDAEADEADEGRDRAWAWLGMIEHALLSWKSRLGRIARRTGEREIVSRGNSNGNGAFTGAVFFSA